jgi:O-antigen/teichoic acid export membrane protein
LFAGSEILLDAVYRGKYNDAAGILRIFVIGALFVPWGTVGSNMQLGMGKPRVSFNFVLLVAGFNIAANLLLLPALGVAGAAVATTLTMMFGAGLQMYYLRRTLRVSFRGIWQRRLDALHFGLACMAKLRAAAISTQKV